MNILFGFFEEIHTLIFKSAVLNSKTLEVTSVSSKSSTKVFFYFMSLSFGGIDIGFIFYLHPSINSLMTELSKDLKFELFEINS